MIVYLAGVSTFIKKNNEYERLIIKNNPFILESFFYATKDTERMMPYFGDFVLDSGAFTFMQNTKVQVDWLDYIDRYAEFIRRNKVEKYFELDIDAVVGYTQVKQFRTQLEIKTNRQCIPVWHISRGIDDFYRLCDEYDHIAIGGIVSGEITKQKYKYLPLLIKEAHKRNTKIHGLGFTAFQFLHKCHWDSVDSTAWLSGGKFGFVWRFNGREMQKIPRPDGYKLLSTSVVQQEGFRQWLMFQKYAKEHL